MPTKGGFLIGVIVGYFLVPIIVRETFLRIVG